MKKIKYSEITPENIYKNRRNFIKKFGLAAGSVFLGQNLNFPAKAAQKNEDLKLTEYRYVTTYNNYYEFGTGKSDPVERSEKFKFWLKKTEPAASPNFLIKFLLFL